MNKASVHITSNSRLILQPTMYGIKQKTMSKRKINTKPIIQTQVDDSP